MYIYINTSNSLQLYVAICISNFTIGQYIASYLTKSLPQIHPNLTILYTAYILYKFCWFCLPIMLALLYSMLLPPVPYYAQNYADIIGSSQPIAIYHIRQNFQGINFHCFHSTANLFLQIMVLLIRIISLQICYHKRFTMNSHFPLKMLKFSPSKVLP